MIDKLIVSREVADRFIAELGMCEDDFIISEPIPSHISKERVNSFEHIKSKMYKKRK